MGYYNLGTALELASNFKSMATAGHRVTVVRNGGHSFIRSNSWTHKLAANYLGSFAYFPPSAVINVYFIKYLE